MSFDPPNVSRRSRPARARGISAFTLLEVLIAIALSGLVFVGLNFFIFSMGEIWGRGSDKRLFDQHVRAVTRFLDREFHAAALPPAGNASDAAFAPQDVRPSGSMQETLLTYEVLESNRLFTWPERPLPEVVCSLQVRDRKGLFILWHSRLETRFEDDSPREVLVSPFVSGLSYDYYDSDLKRWTREKFLKKDNSGAWLTPQRLLIQFKYQGMIREMLLALPSAGEGLPHF
ncbi:MAG: prepilin-type N-terminal cleavage/methylation domain-containing protein [Opitutaceae bacterium]|jgi:prepilin-type N-terminal cleavage/methylation domain-containing protein